MPVDGFRDAKMNQSVVGHLEFACVTASQVFFWKMATGHRLQYQEAVFRGTRVANEDWQ